MKKKIRWIKIRKKNVSTILQMYMQTCSNKYNVYKNGVKAREPYNVYDH